MTSAPGGIMPTISWGRPSISTFCPTSSFFVTKEASLLRLNTERFEQMCIDGDRAHPQRSIPGREVDLAGCVRRAAGRISANRRERPVHLAELDVLWRRERTSGAPNGPSFCRQIHQLIGFWIVEGPQQHSMHDRENGNVCSDPKRQRGDDNSCEPWTLR